MTKKIEPKATKAKRAKHKEIEQEIEEPKEPVIAKCDYKQEIICSSLARYIGDRYARVRRGIIFLTFFDFATGKQSCSPPAFFSSESPNGVFMNYCPWCGESTGAVETLYKPSAETA